MKKTFVAPLLLVALLSSAFFAPRNPVKHTLASTVLVLTTDSANGQPTYCTGFMVARQRALTVAHCVKDDIPFTVDGKASFLVRKGDYFALVSAGDKPFLKLAKQVKLQEPIWTFGFAWGDMMVLRRHVAALKDGDFAIDSPLAPGMSGGPVVNQAGEVVGVNQATNDVVGIVCGVEELRTFLSTQR